MPGIYDIAVKEASYKYSKIIDCELASRWNWLIFYAIKQDLYIINTGTISALKEHGIDYYDSKYDAEGSYNFKSLDALWNLILDAGEAGLDVPLELTLQLAKHANSVKEAKQNETR